MASLPDRVAERISQRVAGAAPVATAAATSSSSAAAAAAAATARLPSVSCERAATV